MLLVQLRINSTGDVWKFSKFYSPRRLVQFWQNFQTSLVLLIPNCTPHRMITYTNYFSPACAIFCRQYCNLRSMSSSFFRQIRIFVACSSVTCFSHTSSTVIFEPLAGSDMTDWCIAKQLSDIFILLHYEILLSFICKQLTSLIFHFIFKLHVTVLVHIFFLHVNLREL